MSFLKPSLFVSLEPIYTVETGSLFIFDANTDDLKNAGGLLFKVKDRDMGVKTNDDVCSTTVPAETLLEATGERLEFKLSPAYWVEGEDAGHIAIRVRRVTSYDQEFMAHVSDGDGWLRQSTRKQHADFMGIGQGFEQLMNTAGGLGTPKAMLAKQKEKSKLSSTISNPSEAY